MTPLRIIRNSPRADLSHDGPMDLESWDDLDLAYLLAFGEHPDLDVPAANE